MSCNSRKNRLLKLLVVRVIFIVLAVAMMCEPFAPAKVYASPLDNILNDVLEEAGLKSAADQIAMFMGENKLEALQKAFKSIAGGDGNVADSAGGTAGEVSQVMKILQDLAATGNLGVSILKSVPYNFSLEVELPELNVGDATLLKVCAWAEKSDLGTVSACIRLDGPGGSQAIVGIGNDNPLGRGNAQHFANEMFIPYAFLDITRNGKSYVHLRLPLVGGLPTLKFEEYLPYGNKYIQVKVGAMDETSVELEFEISLKGTVDAGVSLEGEAKATLSVEASLAVANQLLTVMTKELADAAQDAYSKYYDPYGQQVREITPEDAIDDATEILYRAISTVHSFSQADEEALGEITLGAELSGDIGLGAADTKWPGASLSAELGFSLSSGGLIDISKEMVENFVRFAPQMSNDMKILVDRALNDPAGFDEKDIEAVWQQSGGKAFTDAFFQRVGEQAYGMEISASLDLAGEGDSSDGDNSTINVLNASLEIPEASIPETPDFIKDALKAATMSLTGFLRFTGLSDWVPDGANPISIENDESIAEKMLDGATLSLATSLAPAVQLTADMPAKEFFEVFVGSPDYIIRQLAEANERLSLEPIKVMLETLWSEAPEAFAAFRNSTFGISIGGGTNADLGAEAKISLSAGFNISSWTNVEMLLLLVGADDPGIGGNAGMKASVSAGVGAGGSLGEIVEVGAEGSMTINQNLLSFEFNEVDSMPGSLYYPYDSSNAFLLDIDVIPASGGSAFALTPEFSPGNTV